MSKSSKAADGKTEVWNLQMDYGVNESLPLFVTVREFNELYHQLQEAEVKLKQAEEKLSGAVIMPEEITEHLADVIWDIFGKTGAMTISDIYQAIRQAIEQEGSK